MNWVTIKKAANESGYTQEAIRQKIKKGVLARGKHWQKAPDSRIVINLKEFDSWLSGTRA